MTMIAFNKFSGEIPKTPAHLLPASNAAMAQDCEFAHGQLQPLNSSVPIANLTSTGGGDIMGMFTHDGIKFFSWNIRTFAYKSPVIDDSFDRVYYLTTLSRFCAVADSHYAASVTGGPPASPYSVGLPEPTEAPVLTLVDRTTLADYPGASFVFTAWYEFEGARYDQTTLEVTQVTPLRAWTFTAPTRGANTDAAATLVVQLEIKDINASLVTVNTSAGGAAARSLALPGGLELSLATADNTLYTINLTWGVVETRAYTFTMTNTWYEESAPSPHAIISPTYVQDVQIVATVPSFTSVAPAYRPLSKVNIYRTYGDGANYLETECTFVNSAELVYTYRDESKSPTSVGKLLQSLEWYPPPAAMTALVQAPSGWFAGFSGNTMYMSEPYRPHAWPYSTTFPTNIRGMCVGPQGIVVTTADASYVVVGAHPASVNQVKLTAPQAGLSHDSMVAVDGGVVFASHDGLVFVNGTTASLEASQSLFTREDWRTWYSDLIDINPVALLLGYTDGRLIGGSGYGKGFLFRLDEAAGTFTQYPLPMASMYHLPIKDTLYWTAGTAVYDMFGSTTPKFAQWWSKEFVLTKPTDFAALYINCTSDVDVVLLADDAPAYFANIEAGYHRLPAGSRALKWQVFLFTSGVVKEFIIAESMGELRSV